MQKTDDLANYLYQAQAGGGDTNTAKSSTKSGPGSGPRSTSNPAANDTSDRGDRVSDQGGMGLPSKNKNTSLPSLNAHATRLAPGQVGAGVTVSGRVAGKIEQQQRRVKRASKKNSLQVSPGLRLRFKGLSIFMVMSYFM